ncbi:hypothetical protein RJ639_017096 [Escallonia herrerae]|uniref:Uncharacterized protein n=1 Tax=Escallonia herrerae TaxID=1293975 RepID=A0AA89AM96_9ASTE|nr:hypothetical protein RJ639_017096 [Escallonia herrerae]
MALATLMSVAMPTGCCTEERRRRIEAINGAWAMTGLTAGLVIEGQTGNSIPSQNFRGSYKV